MQAEIYDKKDFSGVNSIASFSIHSGTYYV